MADPLFPMFSVFALLGTILTLIPLPWHLEAWNSGTCFYMIWTSLACLNQFVNSVVWARDAINRAPIWCDISIRIIMGAAVGIPASSLCIIRRLYQIASVQSVTVTKKDKRRVIVIDSLICGVLPLLYIALQYVVQGHRFNVIEEIGCSPAMFNTLLLFFTTNVWPAILGLISAVYCVLALVALGRRRSKTHEFLSSSNPLTSSRYFRLMALAMTEMLFTTPLAIFGMYLNAVGGLEPWISWDDTHSNFSRVTEIPALLWKQDALARVALQMSRWSPVACAFVFFGFFGFAEEARKNYRNAYGAIARRFGRASPVANSSSLNSSIGQYRRPQPHSSPSKASLTRSADSTMPRYKRPDSLASSVTGLSSPSFEEKITPLELAPYKPEQVALPSESSESDTLAPLPPHFARPPLQSVPPERRFTC